MARIEAATAAMFGDVYPLLTKLDPSVTRDRWQRLFDYPWRSAEDGLGYVLVDRGTIVGFIGTLFSRRVIDGQAARLCNTAHWVVAEEFRSEGLRLLARVMQQRECSFTNLTSSAKVSVMFQKLGFQLLEQRVTLLFPVPALRWGRRHAPAITADRAAIDERLAPGDVRIWADHQTSDCGHVVIHDEKGSCYLVFAKRQRRYGSRSIPYCHVHYIGDRSVFLRHASPLAWYFWRTFGAWFVAVDRRLLGAASVPFSTTVRLPVPRYYRSTALAPHQIDNLYTDLVA